jgi:hypothetical protein
MRHLLQILTGTKRNRDARWMGWTLEECLSLLRLTKPLTVTFYLGVSSCAYSYLKGS